MVILQINMFCLFWGKESKSKVHWVAIRRRVPLVLVRSAQQVVMPLAALTTLVEKSIPPWPRLDLFFLVLLREMLDFALSKGPLGVIWFGLGRASAAILVLLSVLYLYRNLRTASFGRCCQCFKL